jgi:hypothetical protein
VVMARTECSNTWPVSVDTAAGCRPRLSAFKRGPLEKAAPLRPARIRRRSATTYVAIA